MFRRNFSLCLISILSCLLASTVAREAIVGGHGCHNDKCGYMVSIQHNGQHICGGGIIGKRRLPLIITAAQCFFDDDNNFVNQTYSIIAATYNLIPTSSQGVRIQVKTIYMPKYFHPRNGPVSDIAILELEHALPQANNYVLNLPRHGQNFINQVSARIAGWGWQYVVPRYNDNRTLYSGDRISATLRVAEAVVLRPENPHYNKDTNNDVQICAQIPPQAHKKCGTCNGDAGSPLVLPGDYVIGILSVGPESCDERFYGSIYTKVSNYRTFIDAIIQQNKNTIKFVAATYHVM